MHLFPGVIDTQVHFREPGLEGKEDLASGSRAAAMGGVTAVFEMPNTNPATTTVEALEDKLERAKGRMWVDHAFYAGASPDNVENLAVLHLLHRRLDKSAIRHAGGTGDLTGATLNAKVPVPDDGVGDADATLVDSLHQSYASPGRLGL